MTTAIRSLSLGITIAVFKLTIPAVDKRRRIANSAYSQSFDSQVTEIGRSPDTEWISPHRRGGEGVLPLLVSLTGRYAVSSNLEQTEWLE